MYAPAPGFPAAGSGPCNCPCSRWNPGERSALHGTWYFETFLLESWSRDYLPLNRDYRMLINSYYDTVGAQHPRPRRGLLTRPGLAEVHAYRRHVDDAVQTLIERGLVGDPERAALWLSDAWTTVRREGWRHPRYWRERDGQWHEFTLAGLAPLEPGAPACHLSYFEADILGGILGVGPTYLPDWNRG